MPIATTTSDTLRAMVSDSIANPMTDTLALDTQQIALWRSEPDLNYDRELLHQDVDLFSRLMRSLNEWLGSMNADTIDLRAWLYIISAIIIAALVVWFLIKNKGAIFFSDKRTNDGYSVEEDNIYGVDFEGVRKKAMSKGNYREAIRMTYLQTLKHLSDQQLINWQIYKTPTQYAREYTDSRFKDLTDLFLKVRYGNFSASTDDCEQSEQWRNDIMKERKEGKDEK